MVLTLPTPTMTHNRIAIIRFRLSASAEGGQPIWIQCDDETTCGTWNQDMKCASRWPLLDGEPSAAATEISVPTRKGGWGNVFYFGRGNGVRAEGRFIGEQRLPG